MPALSPVRHNSTFIATGIEVQAWVIFGGTPVPHSHHDTNPPTEQSKPITTSRFT
jgi:hypothetical protein